VDLTGDLGMAKDVACAELTQQLLAAP